MKDFVEVCKLWPKITEFIHIVDIDDKNDYLKKLEEFKENVKLFHKHETSNFLTAGHLEGDAETFYSHALRFYLPQQAEWLFKKCKVGLRVFLMQGFEHQNKQSKHCYATKSFYTICLCSFWIVFLLNRNFINKSKQTKCSMKNMWANLNKQTYPKNHFNNALF